VSILSATFVEQPTEIIIGIFKCLPEWDAVRLALSHSKLYSIYLTFCIKLVTYKEFEMTAANGYLDILKFIHRHVKKCFYTNQYPVSYAISLAARYGHIDVVKWLHYNGYELTGLDRPHFSYRLPLDAAVNGGHLEITKWLHKKGYQWTFHASITALVGADIEMIKYLYENNMMNEFLHTPIGKLELQVSLNQAIKCGSLKLVEYLYQISRVHRARIREHECMRFALLRGNFDIIHFFYKIKLKQRKDKLFDFNDVVMAARYGHLHILEWFQELGVLERYFRTSLLKRSFDKDIKDYLQFIHKKKRPIDVTITETFLYDLYEWME